MSAATLREVRTAGFELVDTTLAVELSETWETSDSARYSGATDRPTLRRIAWALAARIDTLLENQSKTLRARGEELARKAVAVAQDDERESSARRIFEARCARDLDGVRAGYVAEDSFAQADAFRQVRDRDRESARRT